MAPVEDNLNKLDIDKNLPKKGAQFLTLILYNKAVPVRKSTVSIYGINFILKKMLNFIIDLLSVSILICDVFVRK